MAATSAAAAHAGVVRGPADPISIVLPGLTPDFGYVKQGRVLTRTIEVMNEGVDALSIDPAPLASLTAPFAVVSTTIVAGDVIPSGQRRSITVRYTAPAPGTNSSQAIGLPVQDVDRPGTTTLNLVFAGKSLATDRAAFDLKTSDGRSTIDFGTLKPGQSATKTLVITVQGIDPLAFSDNTVSVTNPAGMTLGVITLTRSTFGAGMTLNPGESGNFDLTFRPTADGTFPGTVSVTGRTMAGDPEAPSVVIDLPIAALAVTPAAPTPTPTPVPTPAPTSTAGPMPSPTSTGGGSNSTTRNGSNGGAGSGSSTGVSANARGRTLAETGSDQVSGIAGGALAVLVCGGAAFLFRRATVRKLRDEQ